MGHPQSKETIEKIRINMLGKKNSLGYKNAIGKHNVSEGGRRRMVLAHLGKKRSAEHIENNRLGQLRRWARVGKKERPRYHHMRDKKYKQWRSDVFQRDNWTCQTCGIRGIYLEAHHIKSWSKFPSLRYEVGNGVALCRECHKLTDNYKNKK